MMSHNCADLTSPAFCEGFTAELAEQRRAHLAQMANARRELADVERRQKEIMTALMDGFRSEAWKAELLSLDARKTALTAAVAEPTVPALHPYMAEVFRQKATTLAAVLDERDSAREALRGFLEGILIPPGDGLLEVVGNVGTMLTAAQGRSAKSSSVGIDGCGGAPPSIPTGLYVVAA